MSNSLKPTRKHVLPPHTIRNLVLGDDHQLKAVELDDGRVLKTDGIQAKLHPNGARMLVTVIMEGEFTVNGGPPVEAFRKAKEAKPVIQVPRAGPLVGADGKPLAS